MHFQKKYYSTMIPSLYIYLYVYQPINLLLSLDLILRPIPINLSLSLSTYLSLSLCLSLSLTLSFSLFISLHLSFTLVISPSLSSSGRHVPLISVVQHKESRVCKLAPSLLKEYCKFHALFEQKSAWIIGIKSIQSYDIKVKNILQLSKSLLII